MVSSTSTSNASQTPSQRRRDRNTVTSTHTNTNSNTNPNTNDNDNDIIDPESNHDLHMYDSNVIIIPPSMNNNNNNNNNSNIKHTNHDSKDSLLTPGITKNRNHDQDGRALTHQRAPVSPIQQQTRLGQHVQLPHRIGSFEFVNNGDDIDINYTGDGDGIQDAEIGASQESYSDRKEEYSDDFVDNGGNEIAIVEKSLLNAVNNGWKAYYHTKNRTPLQNGISLIVSNGILISVQLKDITISGKSFLQIINQALKNLYTETHVIDPSNITNMGTVATTSGIACSAPLIAFVIDLFICFKKWWCMEYSFDKQKNKDGFWKEIKCKGVGASVGIMATFGLATVAGMNYTNQRNQ